jgi:hypothetical protein
VRHLGGVLQWPGGVARQPQRERHRQAEAGRERQHERGTQRRAPLRRRQQHLCGEDGIKQGKRGMDLEPAVELAYGLHEALLAG